MTGPTSYAKRRFTVDKKWGHYVLRVSLWSDFDGWSEFRDVTEIDLPMFFAQLKDNITITFK